MSSSIEIKKGGIVKYLEKLRPEIDRIIEKYIPKKATKEWLEFVFGKPSYSYNLKVAQKTLIEPTWNFLNRGGKRWRPILFLLVTEATGGDMKKIKDFALIPELIHDGTLIIDDIEDQSEFRRGKPCLHKIFGEDIAINVGNFLYYLPLLVFIKNKNKFKPEVLLRAYETYIQEMINIGFGQGTDIFWHKGKADKISEKEYLQMCIFKTGCLSRMSAKLAVILSKRSDKLAEKVGKIAEAIGVAFQIQDDILNLTGEEFGKKKGGLGEDITEGKMSLLVIHTLKKANRKDKKRLIKILNFHTTNQSLRNEAIEIIQKYRSIGYAKKIARKIVADSWKETENLLPASSARNKLEEFIDYLIERKI